MNIYLHFFKNLSLNIANAFIISSALSNNKNNDTPNIYTNN